MIEMNKDEIKLSIELAQKRMSGLRDQKMRAMRNGDYELYKIIQSKIVEVLEIWIKLKEMENKNDNIRN